MAARCWRPPAWRLAAPQTSDETPASPHTSRRRPGSGRCSHHRRPRSRPHPPHRSRAPRRREHDGPGWQSPERPFHPPGRCASEQTRPPRGSPPLGAAAGRTSRRPRRGLPGGGARAAIGGDGAEARLAARVADDAESSTGHPSVLARAASAREAQAAPSAEGPAHRRAAKRACRPVATALQLPAPTAGRANRRRPGLSSSMGGRTPKNASSPVAGLYLPHR